MGSSASQGLGHASGAWDWGNASGAWTARPVCGRLFKQRNRIYIINACAPDAVSNDREQNCLPSLSEEVIQFGNTITPVLMEVLANSWKTANFESGRDKPKMANSMLAELHRLDLHQLFAPRHCIREKLAWLATNNSTHAIMTLTSRQSLSAKHSIQTLPVAIKESCPHSQQTLGISEPQPRLTTHRRVPEPQSRR